MKRLFLENASSFVTITPQSNDGTPISGAVVDRLHFLTALASVAVGAATGSPTGVAGTIKVYHGDLANGSDQADTGIALTALAAASSQSSGFINLLGLKRYISLVVDIAFTGGTSPTIPVSGILTLGDAGTQAQVTTYGDL